MVWKCFKIDFKKWNLPSKWSNENEWNLLFWQICCKLLWPFVWRNPTNFHFSYYFVTSVWSNKMLVSRFKTAFQFRKFVFVMEQVMIYKLHWWYKFRIKQLLYLIYAGIQCFEFQGKISVTSKESLYLTIASEQTAKRKQ